MVNCKLFQLSRKALRDFLKHLELWPDINFRPLFMRKERMACVVHVLLMEQMCGVSAVWS